MTIVTILINKTNNIVVLREGQVGVLRKVCDIPAGKTHQVRTNLTATYKEYWCSAVQPSKGNDKIILTSDDCIDWKEIEIRPKDDGFEWVGKVPANNKKAMSTAPPQQPGQSFPRPAPSTSPSYLARVIPKKMLSWLSISRSSEPESPDRAIQ